jgi:hypothetical protein
VRNAELPFWTSIDASMLTRIEARVGGDLCIKALVPHDAVLELHGGDDSAAGTSVDPGTLLRRGRVLPGCLTASRDHPLPRRSFG